VGLRKRKNSIRVFEKFYIAPKRRKISPKTP
jgi:hypothetical protein